MKVFLTPFFLLLLPISVLSQESLWKAYMDAGKRAYQRNEYDDAERRFTLARKEAEGFVPDDSRLGFTDCQLTLVYLGKKQIPEAKHYSKQAREILEKTIWQGNRGTLPVEVASTLLNIAVGFLNSKDYDEVELVLNQTLKIQRTVLKEYDPAIATSLRYLAITNFIQSRRGNDAASQRKLVEARNHVSEAFTIYENTSDFIDHKDFIQALGNFAIIDEAKKESFLKRALTFREQNNEPEYMDLDLLDALSNLYNGQNKFREAEETLRQRLSVTERTYGTYDSHLAPALDQLGLELLNQEKYVEAEPFLQRALRVRDLLQNPENGELAETLNTLAKNHYYQGKYEEAQPLYIRAIRIAQNLKEKSLENLARYNKNYALLLYALGKDGQADPLFQDYVKNPNEGIVSLALYERAELYRTQKKYDRAEPLYLEALKKMKTANISPYRHATALERFASLLRQTNRESEAILLESEAKQIKATVSGNH